MPTAVSSPIVTSLPQKLLKKEPVRSATSPFPLGHHDKAVPELVPSPLERRPPILAVTIGIDTYASQEYDNLHGAAGDADAFEAFLKTRLGVPQSNIYNLRDEQATRDAIIDSFNFFTADKRYRKNEVAMIFYYAGHGAQSLKPAEWEDWVTPTGNIEMLCPTDIGLPVKHNKNATVGDGAEDEEEVVQGIPDRTMSFLLNRVSSVKGNNITVILDCCSSAGMLRGETHYVARRLVNPPRISGTLDHHLVSEAPRGAYAPQRLQGMFRGSYVLLAACGREQFAWEDPDTKRGLFTSKLLKTLDSEDIDNLTYISLMHRIKIPERQTPHCEGEGIYWRLFNNRVSGADGSFILTQRIKNGPITLQAGSAQGITAGSRFTAHKTNLIETSILPNPPVATLVVTSVDTFSSTLDFASETERQRLPLQFYSKLRERADAKHILIYSSDRQWLESVFPPEVRKELSATIVADKASCSLELTVVDGRVHFDHYNRLVTPWIGSRIRYDVDVDDVDTIRAVVKGSLHFYYHLTRPAPTTFVNVRMELQELSQENTEDFDIIFHPIGKNLLAKEPAEIVVNEDAQLGMTIYNDSDLTLYPYLFYFDPTELTIVNWYMPPFGGGAGSLTNVDAPLPPQSKLAIGYGDGGATPWQFVIPNGEESDLGFFRLFLSTRPAFFDSILQELTPFATGSTRGGLPPQQESSDIATWAVQTATVVQLGKK